MDQKMCIDFKFCPICEKPITTFFFRMFDECKNGCLNYSIDLLNMTDDRTEVKVVLFKEAGSSNNQDTFNFPIYREQMDTEDLEVYEAYKKRVEYWKENERYVAEILRRC